jgi:ADP-heptose:LPS heptosyltransferase
MGEKYVIWHVQGGLGKNIAASSLTKDIKQKHKDRKFILVCSFPEVFLNDPNIDKVYQIGNHPYFYENYIENKDVIIFKHEPYDQTGHITRQKHLIENWCDLLDIKYTNQQPFFPINYPQNKLSLQWVRPKPILLLHTTGGPFITQEKPTPYEWTRDLPIELAQALVDKYSSKYHIIQISKQGGYGLQNVERIDTPMSNMELFSLVGASQQRIFIDSCLQHVASALKLPSIVFWVGTSPKVFGYNLHKNITAKLPKHANQLINSYTFDYQFSNNNHECPYLNVNEMFNIEKILKNLDTIF